MMMTLFNVAIGNAGGGLMDLSVFGILQGTYTKWPLVVLIGLVYAVIYYFVFRFVIEKFNLQTPGRANNSTNQDAPKERADLSAEKDSEKKPDELGGQILQALGGKDNIDEIDNCISRLRLVLKDTSIVDEELLQETGAMGTVIIDENNYQAVYGPKVEKAARSLKSAVKK